MKCHFFSSVPSNYQSYCSQRQHGPEAYQRPPNRLDISLYGLMRQAQMPETICANVVMHLEGLGLYHAACLQEENGLMP